MKHETGDEREPSRLMSHVSRPIGKRREILQQPLSDVAASKGGEYTLKVLLNSIPRLYSRKTRSRLNHLSVCIASANDGH